MLEALWSDEFLSNVEGFGAGVVVLESGRIFGGDSQYFYTGTYEVNSGTLSGEINVTHYFGPANSIFGPDQNFTLRVSGKIEAPIMQGRGFRVDNPDLGVAFRLTRRAELP